MKKAIIILIFIFVISLIVLPLIFVAVGRLKNPVDVISTNNNSKNNQSLLINQNYIPRSGSVGGDRVISESDIEKNQKLKSCLDNKQSVLSQIYNIENQEGKRNKVELPFDVNWYINGVKLTESRNQSGHSLSIKINYLNDGELCEIPDGEIMAAYYDGGSFVQGISGAGQYVTNKGITTLNGQRYYWYLLESNIQLELIKDRKKQNNFRAIYATVRGGVEYIYTFNGNTAVYKDERDFINKTQVFVSGVRYTR
jgi:ABC-type glycerol-3-phosphate transport system permease component